MRYPEFPVGAFIAAVLVLVPLPAHWRSRNIATVSIILWLFALDIIYGVNTIVWDGNIFKRLIVWCDISESLLYLSVASSLILIGSDEARYRCFCCAAGCNDVRVQEPRARRVRTHRPVDARRQAAEDVL